MRAKKGLPPQKITNTAKLNAKTIDRPQPSKEGSCREDSERNRLL